MSIGFHLRQKLRLSGLQYQEKNLAICLDAPTERGQELHSKYALSRLEGAISSDTYGEILGTLDLLDRVGAHLNEVDALSSSSPLRVLDVGAKNWRYLGAIASWLEAHFPRTFTAVSGVEIDAYRMYADLRTRQSLGNHFAGLFSDEIRSYRFVPGDASEWREELDLAFLFFPFVTPDPHEGWGLPVSSFEPEKLFSNLRKRVRAGGILIQANQGDWEWKEASKQMEGFKMLEFQCVENSLHASSFPIFLSLWMREA